MGIIFYYQVYHSSFESAIPVIDQWLELLALDFSLVFQVVLETDAAILDFNEDGGLFELELLDFCANKKAVLVYFYYGKISNQFSS